MLLPKSFGEKMNDQTWLEAMAAATTNDVCLPCKGKGEVWVDDPSADGHGGWLTCGACHGTGRTNES
jgi:DnaJ-class molecular chaperone